MPFEVWIKIAKIVKKSMNIYHGLTVPSQAQYNNIITDKIDSGYKNGPSSLRLADIKIPQTSSKSNVTSDKLHDKFEKSRGLLKAVKKFRQRTRCNWLESSDEISMAQK